MTWSRPEGQRASAGPNLIRRHMMMMMMMITMVVATVMMQSWLADVKWLSASHGQLCDIFGDKSTSDEIHVRPSDF